MKKYRVTDKHSFLKKGTLIFSNNGNISYHNDGGDFTYLLDFVEKGHELSWSKCGWIKEIQKLEFTKDDLLSFGDYCAVCHLGSDSVEVDEIDFNKWKKENES